MHILITGGAGNLGSALAGRLLQRSDTRVTIVDDLSTGKLQNVPRSPRLTFARADVNERDEIEDVLPATGIDVVFHFAAVVGVRRTRQYPMRVFDDINGIRNIAHLALQHRVRRLLFSSSSEVYGEPGELPVREDVAPVKPRLPYSIVKVVGEEYLRALHAERGLDYTILRIFNVFGPRQRNDFVVPKFIRLALQNQPLPVFGDGRQTRTFCYVDDAVHACVNAATSTAAANRVVNIGSDRETSILDLAMLIIALTGSKSSIELNPPRIDPDVRRRCPDLTRIRSLVDRVPLSLEAGIGKMISYYRDEEATHAAAHGNEHG